MYASPYFNGYSIIRTLEKKNTTQHLIHIKFSFFFFKSGLVLQTFHEIKEQSKNSLSASEKYLCLHQTLYAASFKHRNFPRHEEPFETCKGAMLLQVSGTTFHGTKWFLVPMYCLCFHHSLSLVSYCTVSPVEVAVKRLRDKGPASSFVYSLQLAC